MNLAPWSQTQSGKTFPLVDPQPENVCPYDMAYQLAHINRFCGAAGVLSVAQHSIMVADALPTEYRVYGLLHDAHEYPMGDITTPTQAALISYGGQAVRQAFHSLKRDLDRAIYGWAGLVWPIPETIADMVHIADKRAMMTEKRDFMAGSPPWADFEHYAPFDEVIVPMKPHDAFLAFISELRQAGLLTRGEV
jgi:5'-deoxynucleotidase YfbR-like HD superfamily hydrolase